MAADTTGQWNVGFNPFHQHKRRASDYAFVVIGVLVVLALVVWAAFPR